MMLSACHGPLLGGLDGGFQQKASWGASRLCHCVASLFQGQRTMTVGSQGMFPRAPTQCGSWWKTQVVATGCDPETERAPGLLQRKGPCSVCVCHTNMTHVPRMLYEMGHVGCAEQSEVRQRYVGGALAHICVAHSMPALRMHMHGRELHIQLITHALDRTELPNCAHDTMRSVHTGMAAGWQHHRLQLSHHTVCLRLQAHTLPVRGSQPRAHACACVHPRTHRCRR